MGRALMIVLNSGNIQRACERNSAPPPPTQQRQDGPATPNRPDPVQTLYGPDFRPVDVDVHLPNDDDFRRPSLVSDAAIRMDAVALDERKFRVAVRRLGWLDRKVQQTQMSLQRARLLNRRAFLNRFRLELCTYAGLKHMYQEYIRRLSQNLINQRYALSDVMDPEQADEDDDEIDDNDDDENEDDDDDDDIYISDDE